MAVKQMIKYEADLDKEFAQWTSGLVGAEKLRQCLQCGLCSATCPMSLYMDYTPRRLMHLAREGFKDEVLKSFAIWLCASCYACSVECPKQIKLTDVMYAFKRRAMQEGIYPNHRFAVPVLAREFYNMVRSRGRTTETWLVVLLFLKTNPLRFLGMIRLGLGMLRTGRFSIFPESIKRRKELQTVLDAVDSSMEAVAS
jgi:heterodisulfide reductase subunit C2